MKILENEKLKKIFLRSLFSVKMNVQSIERVIKDENFTLIDLYLEELVNNVELLQVMLKMKGE